MSIANKSRAAAKSPKSARRQRRQPDEVRTAALESARKLLLEEGPDAITLKNVARDLEMTHTNLIHHFGSAGELQSALMREMVRTLTDTMEAAVARFRSGEGDVGEFVDIVFDAFDKGGAGRLAAWLMVSGNAKLFAPVGQVVREYIAHVEEGAQVNPAEAAARHARFTATTLFVVTTAFGDAIIGDVLRKMVDRERETVRQLLAGILPQISAIAQERKAKN
jgi:TetR/AcrR family transcriptional regulator, repressor for neighboring sulfatase